MTANTLGPFTVTCPYCHERLHGPDHGFFPEAGDAARALRLHLQDRCTFAPPLVLSERNQIAAQYVQAWDAAQQPHG